ncbi:MAG: polysaccharide deacetylase [uncultured bacterium]|uniref:Polysaccharide deacetylase n=1 Tax=Candidatus Daviesbacteria bacterium GW2011_GWC2_40_12 TaxID=1618431 RepID=A0A0G0TVJ5_9BACT|nr:MAG: polysaccharide deacetylase [uncultured bacterium]KKR16158.1 MAG: Polysaccharide deacetylase [Candidatus Daviesbacteria bacterium GW2011_GWA2_39_33]KKR24569.1 MAG: Polysaccharide deacetylase [Candidatus Daviesbacteria bacterium GW2011_GWB1_39_5]KKR41937.1 MAG: Polysaccharide deacetylase [Candidatus Daviesbacteria bacterium GW2011_GWC2_40_12]OGE21770.1 MAG: hypothetical protein A2778_04855 [Candidatus Daviesbacteria bacterium RIFCSPHIGHO2_01_FULL_40_24]OGE29442.1 MAG: hypothetical protei
MRNFYAAIIAFIFFVFIFSPNAVQAVSVRVPILMYHYIASNPNPSDRARDSLSVSPDKFDAQMQYLLQNGYTPISLDTLYGIIYGHASKPEKPVVLTFDDGYIDFYTNAYPILRKYNFHAVSFIPTKLIGGSYYMSWNQIKEIASSGLVTFEGHTITHAYLPSLSFSAAFKELSDSKKIIESYTGYPVNFIAYPGGSSNGNTWAAAQKAGYVGGLGTWYGKSWGPSMNMPRIKVSGLWNLKEFASRL